MTWLHGASECLCVVWAYQYACIYAYVCGLACVHIYRTSMHAYMCVVWAFQYACIYAYVCGLACVRV
jgi:hypothetical protein